MTHNYEAALRAFNQSRDNSDNRTDAAIIHALKLAHKVTQEPTKGMTIKGNDCDFPIVTDIFKAMIEQAQREIG